MSSSPLLDGLQPAQRGRGPLLQRDYWAVIEGCHVRPAQIIEDISRRFHQYPPAELVTFRRADEGQGARSADAPLQVGDELIVAIKLAGECRVRVTCRQRQSLTLATLAGHPEAGRITFGAYGNKEGKVIFHIRSVARSGSDLTHLGYLLAGEPMQTNTWTDFVTTVALTFGQGPSGPVMAETTTLPPDHEADRDLEEVIASPTFMAEGD